MEAELGPCTPPSWRAEPWGLQAGRDCEALRERRERQSRAHPSQPQLSVLKKRTTQVMIEAFGHELRALQRSVRSELDVPLQVPKQRGPFPP